MHVFKLKKCMPMILFLNNEENLLLRGHDTTSKAKLVNLQEVAKQQRMDLIELINFSPL